MLAAIFGLALGVLICVLVLAVVSEGDRRFIANVHTSLPPGTWVNRVVLADSPSRRCALVIDPTGVSIATASPDHPALSLPWAAIASAVQTPVTVRGSMFAKQGLVITTADGRTFAMLLPGTTPVRFPVTLVHEAERRIHTGIRDGSDTVTVAAPSRSPAGPARNLLTIGAGLLAVIAQIVALTYRVTHHQSASLAPQGYRTYGVVAGTTFWLREIDNGHDISLRTTGPIRGDCRYDGPTLATLTTAFGASEYQIACTSMAGLNTTATRLIVLLVPAQSATATVILNDGTQASEIGSVDIGQLAQGEALDVITTQSPAGVQAVTFN